VDGPVPSDPERAAIEAAARDMGVVPGDPAYPFFRWMLRTSDAVTAAPAEVRQEVAPLLAEVRAMARRPMISDGQIRTVILPWLVAAIKPFSAVIIGLLILLFSGTGILIGRYALAPAEVCNAIINNHPACYRYTGPELPPPPAAEAPTVPQPAPTPATTIKPSLKH
jgi:hypothetical protein